MHQLPSGTKLGGGRNLAAPNRAYGPNPPIGRNVQSLKSSTMPCCSIAYVLCTLGLLRAAAQVPHEYALVPQIGDTEFRRGPSACCTPKLAYARRSSREPVPARDQTCGSV